MAFDKVIDSALLDAGMTATANAIRKKTGNNSPIEWDSSNGFKAAVEVIDTGGGVELPELDTPASDDDVFLGKEYIDGSGQKQSGSFTIDDELTEQDDLISRIANALKNKSSANTPGSLPALDNPGTAGDLAKGKQLIGADGRVIEGSVTEHTPASRDLYKSVDFSDWVSEYDPEDNNYCLHRETSFENDALVRKGAAVSEYVWGNVLGNAKQEDVAQGVTFTSENGLKLEGTMEPGSGGVQMHVDGETLVITGAVAVEKDTLIL